MDSTTPGTPAEASIAFAVQYRTVDSGEEGDWYSMSGRNWDERTFRYPGDGVDETASMDEAVEIALALVQGRSFPHNPRCHSHRTVTDSRVITRAMVGQVTAVYSAR